MKGKIILLGASALLAISGGVSLSKTVNVAKEERDTRIIVELKQPVLNSTANQINASQNSFISYVRNEVTNNINVSKRLSKSVNAVILDVNAKYVSHIRNLPGVKKVDYNNVHFEQTTEADLAKKGAAVIPSQPMENISKSTLNVPANTKEGEGTLIAILDTGFMINATYTTGSGDDEHEWNNVYHKAFTALDDEVSVRYTEASIKAKIEESEGFNGKFDDEHSPYFNSKVPYFYDYGGDIVQEGEERPDREVNPDNDVFDEYNDHGNHVASIAAGNDPYYKGIAPKAQLALMKVFTPILSHDEEGNPVSSSGATDEAILSAFEDCIALGVDVVNMSLGSTLNDFSEDAIVFDAVKNLQKSGVLCAIAAGNDGKDMFYNSAYEYWTTDMVETGILGGYASSDGTIVASGQPDRQYYETALKVGDNIVAFKDQIYTRGTISYKTEHYFVELLDLEGHESGEFEWVRVPGIGEAKDYAELVTDKENKVEGKIAIIDRGEINFSVKIANAAGHGAIAVGIIDNDPSATDFNFNMDLGGYEPDIPVVSILMRDRPIFNATDDYSCKLLKDVIESNPKAKHIADSSSDGATYDLRIKPDITSIGDNVFGAVYENGPQSYEYYSGTSMATPNYAGVYALMLSEHLGDNNWKETLTDRIMSTARPIVDRFNKEFEPVRKQGAGLVNVDAAIKTDVLLDGSNDPENLLGKAKIELKNNESIKNGIVDLNFVTINETESPIVYDTELYVYRPDTGRLKEDNYGELLSSADLMRNTDKLIEKVEGTITVQPGTNAAHVSYTLKDDTKELLKNTFENGNIIEGFLVLKDEDGIDLSIPYLGFFGDYSEAAPVEPFKFERDDSKIYPSDVLNDLLHSWLGKPKADYGSDWVIGNWDSIGDVSFDDYISNTKSLREFSDRNNRDVMPAGTNPYTGQIETQDIYMGNNGYSNTMIIQQYVMRSVETNKITITNKATKEVILVDHMFDSFYGSTEDENGDSIAWPLYKSFVDTTYWSAGYAAHRAYTIIPLYDYSYDEETKTYTIGKEYAEGEYDIEFEYKIAAGGTFKKNYTLHIDNSAPRLTGVENIKVGDKDVVRLRYEELKMSYVSINGYKFQIEEDDKGYYIDIDKSKYEANTKLFVRGYDFSSSFSNTLMKLNDAHNLTVSAVSLTNAFNFEDGFVQGDNSFTLEFSFTKGKNPATLKEDMHVTFDMNTVNADLTKEVKVKAINTKDKEVAVISEVSESGTLSFTVNAQFKIVVTYTAKESPVDPTPTPEPEPTPAKKGCGGSLIAGSAILSITAALGASLLLFKKRKNIS